MRHGRPATSADWAEGPDAGAGWARAAGRPSAAWVSAARGLLAALVGGACLALAGLTDETPDDALLAAARPVMVVGAGWVIVGGLALACGGLPGAAGRFARGVARRAFPVALHGAVGLGVLVASAGPAGAAPPSAAPTSAAPTSAAPSASAHDVTTARPTDHDPAGRDPAPSVGVRAGPAGWVAWAADVGRTAAADHQHPVRADRPDGSAAGLGGERHGGGTRSHSDRDTGGRGDDGAAGRPGASVVVHRGDTLWTIAAKHLGPTAPPAAVQAEWPRWWAANRLVIGPDPDLLRPGQQLRPPATR